MSDCLHRMKLWLIVSPCNYCNYDTWVPTYDIGAFGGTEGEYYVRVSCQVYNEISDIEFLANAILAIILYKCRYKRSNASFEFTEGYWMWL